MGCKKINIADILQSYKKGEISLIEAEKKIQLQALEKINDSIVLDLGRHQRTGIPEVIFAETKPVNMTIEIIRHLLEKEKPVFLSRVSKSLLDKIRDNFSHSSKIISYSDYEPHFITIFPPGCNVVPKNAYIGVITAGSSDLPVAGEVRGVAEAMGIQVIQFNDVGIAGIHRLMQPIRTLLEKKISSIVVVAGMEGALPSVVASLVNVPVIGVPVSTGYGYGGEGVGALMSMLQTCVPGLAVVNIDNGVNAGAIASLIALQSLRK